MTTIMDNECIQILEKNCQYSSTPVDIESVTDENILYWAFLYWIGELDYFEEALELAKNKEQIEFLCNSIVEANVILEKIYHKLITLTEFDVGLLGNIDWLNKFWK